MQCWFVINMIKWKHFPRNWPFVRGIHRSPVNSPHNGQWRRTLMFSLICVWISDWVSNIEAGDLRRYRTNYDVIMMNIWWLIRSIIPPQYWRMLPTMLSLAPSHINCSDHLSLCIPTSVVLLWNISSYLCYMNDVCPSTMQYCGVTSTHWRQNICICKLGQHCCR